MGVVLLCRVEEASKSMWDEDHQRELQEDNDDEDESQLTDEEKQHKKKFREWRKNHYDEFRVFQRAKELLQQVSAPSSSFLMYVTSVVSMYW